jgi:two-component system chemotaxis sensor kinase CheA
MSDFQDMQELLNDFLTEAGELLSSVDNKLVELERSPDDAKLLNDIFRGFHTIKGGAGFLSVHALVELCHLTENLFDQLRNGKMKVNPEVLDVILSSTSAVRDMFDVLSTQRQPAAADAQLLERLQAALRGEAVAVVVPKAADPVAELPTMAGAAVTAASADHEPDWELLYNALLGLSAPAAPTVEPVAALLMSAPPLAVSPVAALLAAVIPDTRQGRRKSDDPNAEVVQTGRRGGDNKAGTRETTVRIDTQRLDDVLNLSGQIGLAKNRLLCLRRDLHAGDHGVDTMRVLDETVNELDHLVGDLQSAAMRTRMQPIGRLFQKYPRLARDLARKLGKEIELELHGEETELDRSIIDELADPLVHLVRNAVDHGIETPEERRAAGKSEKCVVRLSAQQVGDRILIQVSEDGRGMRPELLRRKAVEKGLLSAEAAMGLDDAASLKLIFMPGFSTKDQLSDVSGRGVGMDVVKTNIQKLNGHIEIDSHPGKGTTFSITLPLTLAILPVLVVRQAQQPFAIPLSLVHEIVRLEPEQVQTVSGRAALTIRNEVLPVRSLAGMLGRETIQPPRFGVLMQSGVTRFVLAVDSFAGREDVIVKPLVDIKSEGVAGVTLASDGSVVLVLEMDALLNKEQTETRESLFGSVSALSKAA